MPIPSKLQPWFEARQRFRLSHAHIQIHGARSVLFHAKEPGPWVEEMKKRRPSNTTGRNHCRPPVGAG
jgi:hypothetical protein